MNDMDLYIYTANELNKWSVFHCSKNEYGERWLPARPVTYGGLVGAFARIKAAYYVLIGKADAVIWEE